MALQEFWGMATDALFGGVFASLCNVTRISSLSDTPRSQNPRRRRAFFNSSLHHHGPPTPLLSPTMFLYVFLLCFTLQFSLVFAQFGFFEQMFGGHQQQQQRPAGGMGQWQAHSEAGMSSRCSCFSLDEAVSPKWNGNVLISCHTVECSNYLCPDTLVCVSQPSDCPCPDVQDVKCLIPDAQDQGASTVVCVRGQDECADVLRLSQKI